VVTNCWLRNRLGRPCQTRYFSSDSTVPTRVPDLKNLSIKYSVHFWTRQCSKFGVNISFLIQNQIFLSIKQYFPVFSFNNNLTFSVLSTPCSFAVFSAPSLTNTPRFFVQILIEYFVIKLETVFFEKVVFPEVDIISEHRFIIHRLPCSERFLHPCP
jgi:hypothetical protein